MTAGAVELLGLTGRAVTSDRLTKVLLARLADEKDLDKKILDRAIDRAVVVGVLRPETIQVPAFSDDDRYVADIAVIEVRLRDGVRPGDRTRLAEVLFRMMPRPLVLLLIPAAGAPILHLALTHVSRTDTGRSTSVIDTSVHVPVDELPRDALHLGMLDRTDLWALYRDLVRRAASGGAAPAGLPAAEAVALRQRLVALEAELATVVRDARRERGQAGRIKLNDRARALREEIHNLECALYDAPGRADVRGHVRTPEHESRTPEPEA